MSTVYCWIWEIVYWITERDCYWTVEKSVHSNNHHGCTVACLLVKCVPFGGDNAQLLLGQGGVQQAWNPNFSNIYKWFKNWKVCFSCGLDIEDGHTSLTCLFRKMNNQSAFTWENAQQFITAGYDPCTKGMHKTVLPSRWRTWRGGEENMLLANRCNSLVSASSCYPDPTIKLRTLPSIEDDNVTVVTSNVTLVKCLSHTCTSIAVAACHLWDNPSPQSLNAITIATNQAIANTGATSTFFMDRIDVENKPIATRLFMINLPDGKKVMSTHMCNIHITDLPTVLTGHIVPSLTITSLIGICPLCKAGCKVIFDNDKWT